MPRRRVKAQRRGAAGSPTFGLVYAITKAVNRLPELRHRIRGEQVVEHEVVHPVITVLGEDDLFGLVTLESDTHFATVAAKATEALSKIEGTTLLRDLPHGRAAGGSRDDLLTISILPWLAFTSCAISRRPKTDSISVLAAGKVEEVGGRFRLPFFVNYHHALVDGLHIARFAKYIEDEARELESGSR